MHIWKWNSILPAKNLYLTCNACLDCIITRTWMHFLTGLPIWACPTFGAPPLLRRRYVCTERLGKHGAAHLCPVQPGELAHAAFDGRPSAAGLCCPASGTWRTPAKAERFWGLLCVAVWGGMSCFTGRWVCRDWKPVLWENVTYPGKKRHNWGINAKCFMPIHKNRGLLSFLLKNFTGLVLGFPEVQFPCF